MMTAIFAVLVAAFAAAWAGRRTIAIFLIALTLAGGIKLFLWEVHSPTYGYKMPWIDL